VQHPFRLQSSLRTKRNLWATGLLAIVALGYAGYARLGPARVPAGQISLTGLDRRGFTAFEQMFDDAVDRVRVVALFSPT
jgi:hypothetical protein